MQVLRKALNQAGFAGSLQASQDGFTWAKHYASQNGHASACSACRPEGVICRRTQGTKLVVKDGTLDICTELLKDKAYADAVDIVGLHYPSDFADFSVAWHLTLPPPFYP